MEAIRVELVGSTFEPFWRRHVHGANFLLVRPSAGEEIVGEGADKDRRGASPTPERG